jgi:CxxC motif-containing protein
MTVTGELGNLQVAGNTCPKGAEYAVNECTNPVRTVTSTVRVSNRKDTMVSVKTAAPVPKDKMMDVMSALRRISVSAPVKIGDVVLTEVFGTNIIVTKAID